MSGMTSTSNGIHIVSDIQENINMDIIFSGNLDSFLVDDLVVSFDIFKLTNGDFLSPPIYTSQFFSNPSFNSYTLNPSFPINNLEIDGEYLLKSKCYIMLCPI